MSVSEQTETEARLGTGSRTPKRHIVARGPMTPDGRPADKALCGALWDRLNAGKGPLCEACRARYRELHPDWPLPGGAS